MNTIPVFLIIISLLTISHLGVVILKKETLRRISKSLVIPVILAAYLAGGGKAFLLPVPALILGWIGDILLFDTRKKNLFILGLSSFLLGHLFYIFTFIRVLSLFGSGGSINLPSFALFTPPAIVLGVVVFRLVKPPKEMVVPVIVYMVILIAMTFFGGQVFLFNPDFAGLLILSGCLCFMVSDTILAYYTFRTLKVSGTVFIMLYYIMAQTEIVLGLMLILSKTA